MTHWTPGTAWGPLGRRGLIGDRLDFGNRLLDTWDCWERRRPGGAFWRRRWGEDSRLIRHDPMGWTTETPGTMGNDALDFGDRLADTWDYWERRRHCGFRSKGPHYA